MKTSRSSRYDIKWVAFGIILIAVIAVAVLLNIRSNDDSATKIANALDVDNGDQNIDWGRYPSFDVELSESYQITQSGVYHLTGSVDDGLITINSTNAVVKLILDNVTITNSSGPAISCTAADDLVIELVGENYITDGADYSSDYDEDITGAVYSKADLTFEGEGSINITANYQDGIAAKDDLKFYSGVYNIVSSDDGIRGKDSVYIIGGEYIINSGADAIKSTNDITTGKGFVLIENGTFAIKSSLKGIKAINSILIYDGEYSLNTYDDAIHSNNYVGISGGNFQISSGDDGIHADKELIINNGAIDVAKAYEGLESQVVTINNGTISLKTSDDGINAGGGNDSSAMNRPGAGNFDAEEDCVININGGSVYVNASGDGIDSNGYLYFNGGNVVVDGPTNNGNGALDAGISITMNGGTVIAVGASGMAENLGSASSVYNISVYFNTTLPANTKITIKDSSDNTVLEHISAKTFNHLATGTELFTVGQTYSIYVDDAAYQNFTISNIVTEVGNSHNNFNNNFRR